MLELVHHHRLAAIDISSNRVTAALPKTPGRVATPQLDLVLPAPRSSQTAVIPMGRQGRWKASHTSSSSLHLYARVSLRHNDNKTNMNAASGNHWTTRYRLPLHLHSARQTRGHHTPLAVLVTCMYRKRKSRSRVLRSRAPKSEAYYLSASLAGRRVLICTTLSRAIPYKAWSLTKRRMS